LEAPGSWARWNAWPPVGRVSAMTNQHDQLVEDQARLAAGRDLANWATAVRRLHVTKVPDGVDNLNVEGRRVVGAIQGFGQLWQKTHRIRLEGAAVTPSRGDRDLETALCQLLAAGSHPKPSQRPGTRCGGLLDQLLPGHLRLSSGVMILCCIPWPRRFGPSDPPTRPSDTAKAHQVPYR
jgi:hypothetical protein